jgi:5-methylcytosine-specific restriction endonuclease McrA
MEVLMPYKDSRKRAAAVRAYAEAHRAEKAAYHAAHREKYAALNKQWREANREKRAAYFRAYEETNREQRNAKNRDYAETHREEASARARASRAANPERARVHARNRRALKKENGGTYTPAEWRALLDWFGNVCLRCGATEALSTDHVVPITKGGADTIENLQPLCMACNNRKRTKVIDYRDPQLLAGFLESLKSA